ncbi:MAG: outer membrane beta-barrel protein [Deltaproteobacteria bacterium]|nr:outer membrane beta-barrel protein [Deltaproteobacteria bacterium]
MKKWLTWTLCLVFFFAAGTAGAEPNQTHVWELGAEIFHFTYQEPDTMKDTGLMYGIAGSYAYHKNVMLKVEGRGSWGKVDYSSDSSGEASDINDWSLELRLLAGYDVPLSRSVTLTPFLGVGYRYLYDDFGGHVTNKNRYGYDRESNYYYSPIGVAAAVDLGNGWSWGATAEYDIFWWGRQKSHMNDVPGYYDIVNQQNSGYGARGSLLIQKKMREKVVTFEPFIRYWRIQDSEYTTDPAGRTWYEPLNRTTEVGIKAAIQF